MIRVGVTGGIGSGKTTFCKFWEELGAFVIYADDYAKQLMVSDELLIKKIKQTFGDEAYFEDGQLNRKYLAEEAFAKGRVKELNAIVHPILWERLEALSDEKEKEGVEVFVKEAAILLQHGRPKDVDVVVLVISEKENRIERVMERDQVDAQLVLDRIEKQPEFEELTHLADYIISNDGTQETLKNKATELFKMLK